MDDPKSGVDTYLSTVIFGSSDPLGNLDEADDFGIWEPPDPVAERIAAIANEHRFGKSTDPSWDEEIGGALLEKATAGGTLAKRLGIVRTEIEIMDGERVSKGYDASGEVVHMRWLLPESA